MGLLSAVPDEQTRPWWTPGTFFEIPVERIRASAALWYRWETPWINGYPGEDVPLAPPLGEFEPFDADRYRELTKVPDAHVSYLERAKLLTKKPLMFVHIPHVLVTGQIDTNGLRRIRWDD